MSERDAAHERAAQILRATNTLARTMYRELVRAEYNREEVLRFVNKLLDLLNRDATLSHRDAEVPHWPATDGETGLPTAEVSEEIIEFECRRVASSHGKKTLLVVVFHVIPPSWCSGDVRRAVKLKVLDILQHGTRPTDVLGRISDRRYVLIMPWTTVTAVEPLCRRIAERLKIAGGEPIPDQTRIEVSFAAMKPGMSGRELLEAARSSDPVDILHPQSGVVALGRRDRAPKDVILTLGGGASRALAHAGVIRVLEREGFRIRAIAGTSAGAMIGAMYATGQTPDQIVERFQAFAESPMIREMRRAFVEIRRRRKATTEAERFFRRSNMAMTSEAWLAALDQDIYSRFIEFFIGPDRRIPSLPIPFCAAATDLVHGRAVHLTHGSLNEALRASCAIPGLFPPQVQGDRVLVDGFVLAEAPIAWVERHAIHAPVLAVHLDVPLPTITSFENSVQLAIRASALVQAELTREQLRRAHALLSIPIEEFGWLAFRDAREIAQAGADATEKNLERIIRALNSESELK